MKFLQQLGKKKCENIIGFLCTDFFKKVSGAQVHSTYSLHSTEFDSTVPVAHFKKR